MLATPGEEPVVQGEQWSGQTTGGRGREGGGINKATANRKKRQLVRGEGNPTVTKHVLSLAAT